jgi:small nuclear ribonucleoprotein (snRNP)-like protein
MESWLGKKLSILVEDGRRFEGTFECVDTDANVVLSEATEERLGKTRILGWIMIPGSATVSVHIDL